MKLFTIVIITLLFSLIVIFNSFLNSFVITDGPAPVSTNALINLLFMLILHLIVCDLLSLSALFISLECSQYLRPFLNFFLTFGFSLIYYAQFIGTFELKNLFTGSNFSTLGIF